MYELVYTRKGSFPMFTVPAASINTRIFCMSEFLESVGVTRGWLLCSTLCHTLQTKGTPNAIAVTRSALVRLQL